jgi:hypothetical protein
LFRWISLGFGSPGALQQSLLEVLTSPKVFRISAALSPYLFFSSGLLTLEDLTEFGWSSISSNWKTTLIFWHIEDNIKKIANRRRPQIFGKSKIKANGR